MFQEFEGQKPVVIPRNHMDRARPKLYRWVAPDDWSPAWNLQRSLFSGLAFGSFSSLYSQIHTPAKQLLEFYQFPNSFSQLRIFAREAFKLESFQRGFGSSLVFQSLYGLCFEAPRLYIWRDFSGGYPLEPYVTDVGWYKKTATAFATGLATCWLAVPFNNIKIRYEQDKILPAEHARGYRGYLGAAISIAKNDGFFPFIRGGVPIMAEKTLQTFGLFFWLDFFKEKCFHFKNYGTELGSFSDSSMRMVYVGAGVYLGLLYGYPAITLKHYVESLPLNSRGEPYFASYAEAFWKFMGDHFPYASLWNGFHRYLIRAGPPLFLTMWFADVMGLFDIQHVEGYVVPS